MAYDFPRSYTIFENTLSVHTPILSLAQTTIYNKLFQTKIILSGTIVTITIETLANDDEL